MALYFYRLGGKAGGAERMICALADGLVTRGLSVHLISWDPPNAKSFYHLNPAIRWSRLGFRSGLIDKFRRSNVLARVLRDNGISVLIGFVMSGDKTIYAAAKLASVRFIAAERNAPTMYRLRYGRIHRWISFALLHLADRITVQMPNFTKGYPASLRNRIETIPNPVSTATLRAEPNSPGADGRFTLLAVARLDGVQKQLDCLIGAFSKIATRHPSWDLRIVGDGPMAANLRHLAADRSVADRVIMHESTPDIFKVYARSHLFAIPSQWEGFPNALAEALAHGLPAVGFRNAAGVADLITDGENGWMASGLANENTLAETLEAAMANARERARRGAQAAESITVYSPEAQYDRWTRLIHSVAAGRP